MLGIILVHRIVPFVAVKILWFPLLVIVMKKTWPLWSSRAGICF